VPGPTAPILVIVVLNDGKAWTQENEVMRELPADELREVQESAYVEYVAGLVPLLKKDAFQLSSLGEAKVQNQAAAGILVKAAGKPDVKLYFDPATALLLKVEYRSHDPKTKKEVLAEEFYSDYREVNSLAAEEEKLKTAQVSTKPADLLELVRKQTVDEGKRDKIQSSIRQLGSTDFQVREKAEKEILDQGPSAAPFLSQVANDPDPEVVSRAKALLEKIGKGPDPSLILAALHLLAQSRPAGAAEVLLAYLPSAPNEAAAQAAQAVLAAIGAEVKPDKALTQALEDKNLLRRSAAAAALGKATPAERDRPGQRLFIPGIKGAMKGVEYRDGKKWVEWELIEVEFFNRLDDSAFAKPS